MKHPCLTALVVLLTTAAAHADVGVVVTGDATLQPQLAAQLEGWLARRGHTVIASPLDPDAINTLIDCFVIGDLNCARAVVEKRTKARTVVYVRVAAAADESDGSRAISIVGYWLEKGHETIGERRNCQRCTEADMRVAADDLMHALAAEPPASSHVPSPGKAAPGAANDSPPRRSRRVPGIVIGSGAALAVAGGVLIAIDQDQSDLPTNGSQPANFRDTALPGVICLGVGVAAVAVGTVLWFNAHGSSTPVATMTRDAAVIGWAGRF